MHHNPRLGVEQGMTRIFVTRRALNVLREQLRNREPLLRVQQFSERFRIRSNQGLPGVQAETGEVLGETLVEPGLRGRIVVVQEQRGEVAGDRPPAIFFGEIQNKVVAVLAGKEETRSDRRSL